MKQLSIIFFFFGAFTFFGFSQRPKEIKIGKQIWMTENLSVDKFSNGDPIPQAKTFEQYKKLITLNLNLKMISKKDKVDSRFLAPKKKHIFRSASLTYKQG